MGPEDVVSPRSKPDLHLEVLVAAQRRVLDLVASFVTPRGFFLAGGTGLALQLGHRESHDFDWFRRATFDPVDLRHDLDKILPTTEVSSAPGTLHVLGDGARLTFLAYDYPELESPLIVTEPSFEIASLDDLGAMKLAALLQRGERKDLYDLDALLLDRRSLAELLAAFERKYSFDNTASLLRALTYFDDAETSPEPRLLDPRLSWDRTRSRLEEAVRRYAEDSQDRFGR